MKNSESNNTLYLRSNAEEIYLIDILLFLKRIYKILAISGVIGLSAGVIYLIFVPKQYEAVAQIAMAQIGTINNGSNLTGINVEEPLLLMARLAQPTSFNEKVLHACGAYNATVSAATLVTSIKLISPKGLPNVVELKTFGSSPQAAQLCAETIFELVKTTQGKISAPYINSLKDRIAIDEIRLRNARNLVAKADGSGANISGAYLQTRDEINFLMNEIEKLKNVVSISENSPARLIAPIFAGDAPVAPKKSIALLLGLFSGLFLGLMFVMGCRIHSKFKAQG